jgi:hypothetical protein
LPINEDIHRRTTIPIQDGGRPPFWKLEKGLRYSLRIGPKYALTKFHPISLTINEDIDR